MKNDIRYKQSFDLYVKSTDEKEVILSLLEKEIPLNSYGSFLDIGGGNGDITGPIANKMKKVVVVEPNRFYANKFKKNGFRCLNMKWEEVEINEKFDFILCAYVMTYFKRSSIKELLQKMVSLLNNNGSIVILTVDENLGDWRSVHTFFYKLIGFETTSTSIEVKNAIKCYPHKKIKFTTKVITKTIDDMIETLAFDFEKFGKKYEQNRHLIYKYLQGCVINSQVVLKNVQWAYIIKRNGKY